MQNFREFEAGPDPFGRKYKVLFKWMQTAISLRHADTVDVKFLLIDPDGVRTQKTIAIPHVELLRTSEKMQRDMDDAWCCRIAALRLMYLVSTGEDMEKDLVTLSAQEVSDAAAQVAAEERNVLQAR
jgi:hypothetical protein